jgi:hypothetical protein
MRQATKTHRPAKEAPHKVKSRTPPVGDPEEEAELPFQTGAADVLDPDLRHRMVSEAAYYLYQQRGCTDGYELDDWLQAEAQIDHIALRPLREAAERAAETRIQPVANP